MTGPGATGLSREHPELVDHIIYMGDGRCASTRMQCPDLWADGLESDAATTMPSDEH